MKFQKVTALILSGLMAVSAMTACGSSANGSTDSGDDTPKTGGGKSDLVIWTLADDMKQFAERYEEKTGIKSEVVVIAPADYPTKLTTALGSKASEPDIIVGEPQMLPNFYEAGFFEDLSQAPYNAGDYRGQLFDYVYEAGSDDDGIVRALSYQVTPGSIVYRRDLAQEIWGTEDPEKLAPKFESYPAMVKSAEEAKAKGYRLFSSTSGLGSLSSGGGAWVVDGKLNLSESRLEYMDAAVTMYQKELIAFAPDWSSAWYASMSGPLPSDAEWEEDLENVDGEMTEVVSYVLPSWGALIIRDNADQNIGKFGITAASTSFFQGGTFLGINTYSQRKEAAWEFIQFVTLNEETSSWWLEHSKGDVVSLVSVLEANKDFENEAFGGQKTYEFYLDITPEIDYSLITKYDTQIGDIYGQAIDSVQRGAKTKEEAIDDFLMEVESIYPELEISR